MSRRAYGALEADVMQALWALDRPASPSDVIEHMQTDLAYTSIATILGRLCDKGLAERQRLGRAYVYRASATEAELTAALQAGINRVSHCRAKSSLKITPRSLPANSWPISGS